MLSCPALPARTPSCPHTVTPSHGHTQYHQPDPSGQRTRIPPHRDNARRTKDDARRTRSARGIRPDPTPGREHVTRGQTLPPSRYRTWQRGTWQRGIKPRRRSTSHETVGPLSSAARCLSAQAARTTVATVCGRPMGSTGWVEMASARDQLASQASASRATSSTTGGQSSTSSFI